MACVSCEGLGVGVIIRWIEPLASRPLGSGVRHLFGARFMQLSLTRHDCSWAVCVYLLKLRGDG